MVSFKTIKIRAAPQCPKKRNLFFVFFGGVQWPVLKCYVFHYLVARLLSGVMFSNTFNVVVIESFARSRRRLRKCYVFRYFVGRRLLEFVIAISNTNILGF